MKKTWGLRTKLFLGFFATITIFLLAIILTLSVALHVKDFNNRLTRIDLPTYDAFTDLNSGIFSLYSETADNNVDAKLKNINLSINKIDRLKADWSDKSLSEHWSEIKTLLAELPNIVKSNDHAKLGNAVVNLRKKINAIHFNENLNQGEKGIIDELLILIHADSDVIIKSLNALILIEIIAAIFGTLIAVFISVYTSKNILNYLARLRKQSSRVAKGDLQHQIEIDVRDEIGELAEDLNVMTKNLADITKEITASGHTIASMLEEVKSAMESQASGAAEQAASINEITASLTEIEKSSQQTMEKAKVLGTLAENSRQKGKVGLDSIELSVKGMKSIREKVEMIAETILDLSKQTQQVGDITTAVNNFALQSKMLALNASIEAVKAGESGKGFAVVAAEVKNLAEQSEESTLQVQKILENIRHATEKAVMVTEEGTKGVDEGTSLVEQTGDIIQSLNKAINEASIASQQIEAAVRQEAAGIEQITMGMNEINQVTASFVNNVKQTNEAMLNLSQVARNLRSQIEVYKT